MPDISDLSEKSGKMKSSGSGRRSKANDANLSLNAEVEASLMERASRASPANRPLPFISVRILVFIVFLAVISGEEAVL